jgi:excisionase family DNA binding protein
MEKQRKIEPSNLMTIKDYAQEMKVTKRTIYNWIDCGRVKKVMFLGVEFIDKSTFDYTIPVTTDNKNK